MRTLLASIVLASTLAAPAMAQQKPNDHGAHHATLAATSSDMTEGEIRKLDKGTKKVTIRHGEIKNLGMPPMTMVFQVRDAAALDKLKVGDKVRFVAAQDATGLVATDIQPAP